MRKIKTFLNYISGRVHISKELLHRDYKILMHISDTPYSFKNGLRLLLKRLEPEYVIHTGDIVDNIKLQIYPSRLEEYSNKVKKIINVLEQSTAKEIYLVIGNHDDLEIVKKLTKRCKIITKKNILNIEDKLFNVAHYPKEVIESNYKYNLFGHDLSVETVIYNGKMFLNGIQGINILNLNTEELKVLPYPFGTNEDRFCKKSIGLWGV